MQSLDDQLSILEELAEREGYAVVEILKESKSAKDPGERPEFEKLIELIEGGQIDGVLTWHINRLSRNMVDGGKIAHLLHQGHLRFIRTPDRVFRPEDNVVVFAVENATATNFIQELRRNVARGMNSKAEKGWFPGRAPLGYRNNLLTNQIEADPERFRIVRNGWEMLLSGECNLAEVYRSLIESGLTMWARGGRTVPLRQKTAYDVFANIFYTGRFKFRGEFYNGAHVPMVTEEEFNLVQYRLAGRVPRAYRRKHRFAYAGLFRCPECGLQIVAEQKRKLIRATGKVANYVYYHCSGRRGCNKQGIREEMITEAVMGQVAHLGISPGQAEWCRQALAGCFERHASDSAFAISQAQQEHESVQKQSDRLTMLFLSEELGKEDFSRAKATLQVAQEKAEQRLKELRRRDEAALDWVTRQIDTAVKIAQFKVGNTELRRSILQTIGGTLTLSPNGVNIQVCEVLRKIAQFEPPTIESGSSKPREFSLLSGVWGAWCEAIRTAAHSHVNGLDTCCTRQKPTAQKVD